MALMCPKLPNQQFEELPFEEAILTFLRDLGHSEEIVNKLHQPWRSFAAVINKCLSGNGYSRKRAKRKPKASNSKHGVEEGKVKRDQTANSPKKVFFPAPKPSYNWYVAPYLLLCKTTSLPSQIISSTLLPPPSCIKAMLAIPHLSQVSSMAKIDSKEAQMKSKAGICFGFTSHNKHTSFLLSKEAQAASPRLRL
ncbi:hypothetical protein Tco_1394804 [Tanacetum coccineum]